MRLFTEPDHQAVTALRILAIDQVEKARSGHPGLPLGAAPMVYVLFSHFLRFNPHDPSWPDRDRFVLSAGHGSALLYAALHLFGYDLPLEELQRFRQWGSKTPGHPEFGLTPGVETTTGPLGQGFATAVGMALAEQHLAARFNRESLPVVNHRTFVLASDGDLMEGISHEAAALAGHWKLGGLVVLYDDNRITIEGPTSLAWSEDTEKRFAAYGWKTLTVEDGNDLHELYQALAEATSQRERPVLIRVRTIIGFGAPTKGNTAEVHGAPLGPQEYQATRENLGWSQAEAFSIPEHIRQHFREKAATRAQAHTQWKAIWERYQERFPREAQELSRRFRGELPSNLSLALPLFTPDTPLATREASGYALNRLAELLPELMGGSADLAPSNNSLLLKESSFQAGQGEGRNLHFGVREHAMAAIANGMSLHGGIRPYVATFLVFSDYLRPALRLSALMKQPVTYIFTHDSIGLGEDGPTHQPVEHLPALRQIPNLWVIRPADANETSGAWGLAVHRQDGPVALALSRQKLPVLPTWTKQAMAKGAYILKEASGGLPEVVIWASGSEVHVAVAAQEYLEKEGIPTRVVSAPCLELFSQQTSTYQREVRGPCWAFSVGVEAARGSSLRELLGKDALVVSLERFGASAPGSELFQQFGFTGENLANKILHALGRRKLSSARWEGGGQVPGEALMRLQEHFVPAILARDASAWGKAYQASAAQRLGWLDLPHRTLAELPGLASLVAHWVGEGVETLYLLGMGGSSLAPQVLRDMLGSPSGRRLEVVDTTDPVRVNSLLENLDPQRSAVLAVSKSGTTVETTSLLMIFWQRFQELLPKASQRFAVLTEPGTALAEKAREHGYARVVFHPVDVGGRFSALSAVGILPALWLGIAPEELLAQADVTLRLNSSHPALALAASLFQTCQEGWGRLLLWPDGKWASFTPWLEQLIAESTGKEGKGVLPIAPSTADGLAHLPGSLHVALGKGELPLGKGWSLPLPPERLGEAFAFWQLVTVAVGFLLGVNPFDEPNVSEAKAQAKAALEQGKVQLQVSKEPQAALERYLLQADPKTSVAFLAYLPETEEVSMLLRQLAQRWQQRLCTTVTFTYGPRYLHATGQLYKGGPRKVLPVILTGQEAPSIRIPGKEFTLGELRLAQAAGDAKALASNGKPVLHLHLGGDGKEALAALVAATTG
ncbi:MAG: transketolase [Thermoanaerobaculaceae bacterium]